MQLYVCSHLQYLCIRSFWTGINNIMRAIWDAARDLTVSYLFFMNSQLFAWNFWAANQWPGHRSIVHWNAIGSSNTNHLVERGGFWGTCSFIHMMCSFGLFSWIHSVIHSLYYITHLTTYIPCFSTWRFDRYNISHIQPPTLCLHCSQLEALWQIHT